MTNVRFTKFNPVGEKYAVYECYLNEVIIFEVTKDDSGSIVICFYPAIAEATVECDEFLGWVAEVRRRAAQDQGVELD